MVRDKDGTDKVGCTTINKICEEIVGFKCVEIAHAAISDRASKSASIRINHDEGICDMHDCDKIGKS